MKTVVARVLRVLGGHSPTGMIHAVGEHGHEQKLEVPVESTRDVAPGDILVLQWSVHRIPSVDVQTIEIVEVPPAAPPRPNSASGTVESTPASSDGAAQLEALLGLRPGRLRGSSDLP